MKTEDKIKEADEARAELCRIIYGVEGEVTWHQIKMAVLQMKGRQHYGN